MHVAKVAKKYMTKDGASRESVAYLLRRTYRDGTKVRHETLANLWALPQATLEAVRVSLTGQTLVVPGQDLEVTRACRTDTSPRSTPRPRRSACRRCWVRPGGTGTSRWP